MTINTNGRVGIGYDSPSYLLDVNGAARINGDLNITGAGDLAIFDSDGTGTYYSYMDAGVAYLRIDDGGSANGKLTINNGTFYVAGAGGNVGVGITTPLAKLQVNSTTSGGTVLRADGTNGTLFSVVDDLSDSLMSVNNSAGLPVLEVFADDRVVMGQYGQNDLVVRNNKVGLGTVNPQYRLNIYDVSSGSVDEVFVGTIGSDQIVGGRTGGSFGISTKSASNGNLILTANSSIYLRTGGSNDRVFIKSDGSVGIGTVSPSWLLTVYAATAPQFALQNGTRSFILTNNSADNLLSFYYNSANRLQFDTTNQWFNTGNLGVGTTSSVQKLDVIGNIRCVPASSAWAEGLSFSMPTAGTWGGLRWRRELANADGNHYIGYTGLDSTDDLVFGSNNGGTQINNNIRITKAGLVGIGIAPNAKLDVSGVIRGDAGANYPHSFTNTDAGNTHWTNRGERLLTSNGGGWQADGRDPIMALVTSGNTNNLNIANSIGLALHNESQTDNTYSPAITFSNRSNSGSYNTAYATIIGKKTGQGVDANWSAGELHFYTMPAGAYIGGIPSLMINSAGYVGIGTTAPTTLLQIGTGVPTTATLGIQFGSDTLARLYRSQSGFIFASGSFRTADAILAGTYLQTLGNLIYPNTYGSTLRLETSNIANNAWIDGLTVAPGGIVTIPHIFGQNQYSFRGANRAVNDWDTTGLTIVPTVNDYGDGSWYIDAGTSNSWDRGILSKAKFLRVEGLTLEYESFTQVNSGTDIYCMIGFVGGETTNYNYNQTPANLTYQDNGGLSVFTNGGGSGTDYSFDTRNAWWRFKTVLKGRGALHYVYRNGIWNLIKETDLNNQNDYEWVRVLVSLYRQRIYFRDVKVYVAQNYYRGANYISNIPGNLGIGTSSPATLLQVGTGSPTAVTGGLQFGDDTGARLYRSGPSTITCSGTIAGTFSGTATNASQLGGVAAANYVRNDVDGTDSTGLFRLKTFTKSLTVTNAWIDTGISSSDLATGIYIMSLYVNNFAAPASGAQYWETYGGVMSWYQDGTNDAGYDEIPLHKSGHAPNGRFMSLRTLRTVNGVLKLQIVCNIATSGAADYVFKFRRMI